MRRIESRRRKLAGIGLVLLGFVSTTLLPLPALAAEIGHFAPGVLNIRDFSVPEPGVYFAVYNYAYTTDRLNDRHGDDVDSVTVGPATLGLDVDFDMYALAPTLIWVSDWKILGAKYAAYVSPSFANLSLGAALATATGSGRDVDTAGFDVADLFVQPIWLGWTFDHFDFALGYGFYAPVGAYKTENVTLPVIGTIEVEDANNTGLGFWTNQIQGSATWLPFVNKATAVTAVLTYEIHENKQHFDINPGQNLTLNWGISQYLPLRKDQSLLLEVGPLGYSTWQVSDDRGSDVADPGVRDDAHAAGGQIGLTYVPWSVVLNFHATQEFSSQARFQGTGYTVSLAKKFF